MNYKLLILELFVDQARVQAHDGDHCLLSSIFRLCNSSIDRREEVYHKGDKFVPAMNEYHGAYENKASSKRNVNGSNMKRNKENKTDSAKVTKVSKITSRGSKHCQRSEKISTTATDYKAKTIEVKNSRKQKDGKIEKTASVIWYNMRSRKCTKNNSVSSCTKRCTDSLRTGKMAKKVTDVHRKRTKTKHEGTELRCSFVSTMKSKTKMTDCLGAYDADLHAVYKLSDVSNREVTNADQTMQETTEKHVMSLRSNTKRNGDGYCKAACKQANDAVDHGKKKTDLSQRTEGMRTRYTDHKDSLSVHSMALRSWQQLHSGNGPQGISLRGTVKHRSLKSADNENNGGNSDQKLYRCSTS